jgi:uncharacterized protein
VLSALFVVLAVGASVAYALRMPLAVEGEGVRAWLVLASIHGVLAGIGIYRLQRQARLSALARVRPGDLSIGITLALLLAISSWALARWLMPVASVERAWLLRIAVLLGQSSSSTLTIGLVAIAVCEELVWRGWVQTELGLRLGARAWMLSALLYALAHAATLATLRDSVAGPNPLLFLSALGCGLCWSFLRERTGRLFPGLVSHAAFTYLATQYVWRFI